MRNSLYSLIRRSGRRRRRSRANKPRRVGPPTIIAITALLLPPSEVPLLLLRCRKCEKRGGVRGWAL